MARIEGIKREDAERESALAFNAQERRWGAPLVPHLIYARRPSIHRGARGMWIGLGQSGLLDPGLAALINVRVATINKCPF